MSILIIVINVIVFGLGVVCGAAWIEGPSFDAGFQNGLRDGEEGIEEEFFSPGDDAEDTN